MKMICQHDEYDCGAAALAMILSYFGSKVPMAVCRELTNTDKDGTNFYGIISGAKKCGIIGEALQGNITELIGGVQSGEIKVPFIAHCVIDNGRGHFVVVRKITSEKIYIYDPAKGKRKLSIEEFGGEWTGNIINFIKDPTYNKINLSKGIWSKFFILLRPHVTKLVGVVLLSLLVAVMGIITAFIFQTIVDNFGITSGYYGVQDEDDCDEEHEAEDDLNYEDTNLINNILTYIDNEAYEYTTFFIFVIILYIIQGILQYVRTMIVTGVSKKIDMEVTMLYYIKSINLPIFTSLTRKTGEYLSRLADTSVIRDAIVGVTVNVFLDICIAIGYGILLFSINSRMFIVACMVLLLYGIVIWSFYKPLNKINRNVMENVAQTESYLKESYDGSEVIKTLSSQNNVITKVKDMYSALLKHSVKKTMVVEFQDIIADTTELIGNVIIMWLGFSMVISGRVTIGSLLSFFIILNYFTAPVKGIITLQPTVQSAVIAADRLNDVLLMRSEAEEDRKRIGMLGKEKEWNIGWKNIIYDNVYYQYGNNAEVLKNINLTLYRGKCVAIVGKSGSGKTTIAKMLAALYRPTRGSVLLDNDNFDEMTVNEIRKYVIYIKQDAYLFSDTIYNNLTLGNKNIQQNIVDDVCKCVDIYDTINQLPNEYNFYLQENGNNLSAGQRQRIALARGLLLKPQVIILDEATSSLDFATENRVLSNICKNYPDMTIIMIAHRLQSIKKFDQIYVISDGQVTECGTHEQLLSLNREYRGMWDKE